MNAHTASLQYYADGTLNVAENCIDRHLATKGDQASPDASCDSHHHHPSEQKASPVRCLPLQVALVWEKDQPNDVEKVTYQQLHDEVAALPHLKETPDFPHPLFAPLLQVARLANAYKRMGVKKGDIVTLYMPMVPHAVYAMLACARIGAVHSVVFAGFSAEALAQRMTDAKSRYPPPSPAPCLPPGLIRRLWGGSSSPPTKACGGARPSTSKPSSTRLPTCPYSHL